MSHQAIFYCPVQIYRFPGMTLNEVYDIDDLYEDHIISEYETPSTDRLKSMIDGKIDLQDMFGLIDCCDADTDEYKEAHGMMQTAKVGTIEVNDALWLKLKRR